uniref:Anaphase-promoting complex subunit 11 RING-H2 finger domain-containing protein n=2 Tax=Pyxicephalus adspersus TaxID=30357 RepID=A0AAV3AIG8_PYXAD|nr:TPA: hypothetical protein GDO54_007121 [Pyxicephalus adspersus]
MTFNGCCIDCKIPGDNCPLDWIVDYLYCFHMLCILKCLNSQQVWQYCSICCQKFKE